MIARFSTFLLLFFSLFPLKSRAQFFSQISSVSTVVSNDVAVDAAGNVYITGGFIGTASFNDTAEVFSLTSMGLKDVFVGKYSQDGVPLWGFSVGGIAGGPGIDDEGFAIAVSPAGNVFVTGYFQGTADFDPGDGVAEVTSQGFRDVFLASYTADGAFRWVESFGGTGDDRGLDVGLRDNEKVYFTGFFRETGILSSDNTTTITSAGEEDGYLLSMNQDGNFNSIFGFGDISVDKGHRVDVDGAGNIYLAGIFSRNVDFDPGDDSLVLSSLSGGQDGVLAKYTVEGSVEWALPLGSELTDGPTGLAVDAAGNAFITGHFTGTLNFDPLNTPNEFVSVGRDHYLAGYSTSGSLQWAFPLGTGFAEGSDVAINSNGDVLVSGFFTTDVFPDPQSTLTIASNGQQDMLLASYQSDGTFRWANGIGGLLAEVSAGVALDDAGNAYLTGYFEDEVDFNPGGNALPALSEGSFDGFLVKYGPGGSLPVSNEEPGNFTGDFTVETFPNPAVHRVDVRIQSVLHGPVQLEMLDILGRQLLTRKLNPGSSSLRMVTLDVSSYPAGLYFIRITGHNRKTVPVTILK